MSTGDVPDIPFLVFHTRTGKDVEPGDVLQAHVSGERPEERIEHGATAGAQQHGRGGAVQDECLFPQPGPLYLLDEREWKEENYARTRPDVVAMDEKVVRRVLEHWEGDGLP